MPSACAVGSGMTTPTSSSSSSRRDYLEHIIVKVYAAVVGPDPTVTRTTDCAVLAPDQLAAWLDALPPQRSLTEARRERVAEMVREAAG